MQDSSALAAILRWFDHTNDPQDDTVLLSLISAAVVEPTVGKALISIGADEFLKELEPHMSTAQQKIIHSILTQSVLESEASDTACEGHNVRHHYEQQWKQCAANGSTGDTGPDIRTPALEQSHSLLDSPTFCSFGPIQTKYRHAPSNAVIDRQKDEHHDEVNYGQSTVGVPRPHINIAFYVYPTQGEAQGTHTSYLFYVSHTVCSGSAGSTLDRLVLALHRRKPAAILLQLEVTPFF